MVPGVREKRGAGAEALDQRVGAVGGVQTESAAFVRTDVHFHKTPAPVRDRVGPAVSPLSFDAKHIRPEIRKLHPAMWPRPYAREFQYPDPGQGTAAFKRIFHKNSFVPDAPHHAHPFSTGSGRAWRIGPETALSGEATGTLVIAKTAFL
jgi:hypothetical protein